MADVVLEESWARKREVALEELAQRPAGAWVSADYSRVLHRITGYRVSEGPVGSWLSIVFACGKGGAPDAVSAAIDLSRAGGMGFDAWQAQQPKCRRCREPGGRRPQFVSPAEAADAALALDRELFERRRHRWNVFDRRRGKGARHEPR